MTTDTHFEEPAPEGGRSFGRVFFALGLAGVPPGAALAGPVLIHLLGDLGLSAAAARSTVLRMRRAGWLTSERTGRTVAYSPSPAALVAHERHRNQFIGSGPHWDGAFHALLVTVPERERAFRDELRRVATVAGYRTLRSGLLIAPSDRREELASVLGSVPSDASLVSARLELSQADTRRVAADLWRLEELSERYRAVTQRAVAATERARDALPTGALAVQELAAAALPIYEAITDDPGLPPDLLPPDWPGSALSTALGAALRTFGPPIADYVGQLQGSQRNRSRA